MTETLAHYRGRFAPSPTGPLHFGSLIAALGSYLEARSQNGQWLIRIDDIDPPREVAGASDLMIKTLAAFGFEWDESIEYQSQRHEYYKAALQQLQDQGDTYPCGCSRKEIAAAEHDPDIYPRIYPGVYPGTCRAGLPSGKTARQIRFRVSDQHFTIDDALQGPQHYDLAHQIGDFVILRADGFFAYQLATAVDDALQGITHVVRGHDLLTSTPRQCLIQQRLGYSSPGYCHLPVAVNETGQKLSKQNLATGLDLTDPVPQLINAMTFLGQQIPADLHQNGLNAFWDWAISNWKMAAVPRKTAIRPEFGI